MTHIFLNGLGASAGAGLTYLYNVVPRLSSIPNIKTTLALQPPLRKEFQNVANIHVLDFHLPPGTARRFWFEQRQLPRLVEQSGADLLVSAGNFAVRNSPVPQILLSGNSLYTSDDFYRDLRRRGEYRIWLDTRIRGIFAKKSVHWADCTVAPSQAFAHALRAWTGKDVKTIYHGFDPELFFRDQSPLPASVQERLQSASDSVRLLFVSHYNYYRNFETLFRALAILRGRLPKVRLFLTCTLDDAKTPGVYKTGAASRLIQDLGIREEVVELGAIPYGLLHHLYRACDIYVTAAYAETFAHPLVEAMACGLPIVASDIPVHREISAMATYFDRFSPDALADAVISSLARIAPAHHRSRNAGPHPVRFGWSAHVEALLELASQLDRGRGQHAAEIALRKSA